jgi:hypothetical protein
MALFAPRYMRVLCSYSAAAIAGYICIFRDHVHVAWRIPETWSNVLAHRCGQFMLVCMAWALVELVIAMVLPRERDGVLPPLASA